MHLKLLCVAPHQYAPALVPGESFHITDMDGGLSVAIPVTSHLFRQIAQMIHDGALVILPEPGPVLEDIANDVEARRVDLMERVDRLLEESRSERAHRIAS